jgi:SAM-dependent methyltransferase
VTLTDISPRMLKISRALNPECQHITGDMRSLQLGKTFDVVLIHDAICYMTSLPDLERAIQTAYTHCNPGGFALFVPDCVRETFQPSTEHGGKDGETRALRYLEWTYNPDGNDTTYISEFVYLLREELSTSIEHEQHVCGLFARQDWLSLLRGAGFEAEIICDPYERDIFIGHKLV